MATNTAPVRTNTAPMRTNAAPMRKPTLALSTPSTANFPKDVLRDIPSAISATTPLSALSMFREPLPSAGLPSAGLPAMTPTSGPMSARIKHEEKTPITPPLAYLDFLKSISLQSPPLTGKMPAINRTSTSTSTSTNSTTSTAESSSSEQEKGEVDSAPSTATSEKTDVSCKCDDHEHEQKPSAAAAVIEKMKSPKINLGRTAPMSPLAHGPQYPLSAPATNLNFPSLNMPTSPLSNCGGVDSPRSPWSARSIRSPFDWDAALKSRRFTEVPGSATAGPTSACTTPKTANAAVTGSKREGRTTVRNIREVVTRTVTYTPRMAPAPKGKRRKLDHETAVDA